MTIKGLIFDFDGLILDTETPDVIAWVKIYKKYGQEFDFSEYASAIGSVYEFSGPARNLVNLVPSLNLDGILQEWLKLEKELIEKQPIQPGIMDYLKSANQLNLQLAIASSAERTWVRGHLIRLGIEDSFNFIHTVDDTKISKPSPALYNLAMKSLQLKPVEVIAFEDSTNGISAAKAAGIFCVAVPNQITRLLQLDQADLILDSLANLPLSQLLIRFNQPTPETIN
jgi:HAD superfamily hydrolase (TIGR01509 family)